MTILRIPTRVSAAADRPASCGNQTISSTRPSCWIQISTVDVINIVADHQMFMTLRRTKLTSPKTISRWLLLKKRKNRSLSRPLVGLRTPCMARWKALGRLYIHRNWTFFVISYGWDVMSGNRSKSAFFEGVGYFERRFQREGGIAHQPLLVSEN